MCGSGCRKDGEQTQVSIQGNGAIGLIQAITDDQGLVRGLVGNPAANAPIRGDGKLDVGQIVGKGVVTVVRSRPGQVKPYTGIVPIYTGEIAEDLAYYLVSSEQTRSALALGVSVRRDGSVQSAGGFLLEVLPDASDSTVDYLEDAMRNVPTVTNMLSSGYSTEDIAEKIVGPLALSDSSTVLSPRYGPCGKEDMEKSMLSILAALGKEELDRILEEEGKVEIRCEYCNEQFEFDEYDLKGLGEEPVDV